MPHQVKYLRKDSFSHFLRFFRCTGLASVSEKKITFRAIFCFFIIPNIHGLLMSWIQIRDLFSLRITLLHLSCYTFSTFIWLSVRYGRHHLTSLLRILSESHELTFTWTQSVFFYVICSEPLVFSALKVIQEVVMKNETSFDLYGLNASGTSGVVLHFLQTSLWSFIYPTSVNLVVLLYCFLCHNISQQIKRMAHDVQQCTAQDFTLSKQANIISQEAKISDLLYLVQETFSVPSLLISAAHFCACITDLGYIILDVNKFIKDFVQLCLLVLVFANSSGGLLACLWTAGGLPLAEDQLKEAFRRKTRERLLLIGKVEEEYFQKELMQKPSFLMSGCGIVYYQRSSILSLLGIILTYTILLITKT